MENPASRLGSSGQTAKLFTWTQDYKWDQTTGWGLWFTVGCKLGHFCCVFPPEKVLLGCDAAQSCKSIVSEEEISSGIDFGFGGREGGGGGSIFRK